jgi:hypothetical protein
MLSCGHVACEDCTVKGQCAECFVDDHPGAPVVICEAGRKGWYVLWKDGEFAKVQQESFARALKAYSWAAWILSGQWYETWETLMEVFGAFAALDVRQSHFQSLVRECEANKTVSDTCRAKCPRYDEIEEWLYEPLCGPAGMPALQAALADEARSKIVSVKVG